MESWDYILLFCLGVGLQYFAPQATSAPWADRPLLVLHLDEGSPGYAMCWYMAYQLKLRMVFIRDIYHREWNDVSGALKGSWPLVCSACDAHPFQHGIWALAWYLGGRR